MIFIRKYTRSLSLSVNHELCYAPGEHRKLTELLPRLQHLSLSPPPRQFSIPQGLQIDSLRLDFDLIDNNLKYSGTDVLMIIAQHLWLPSLRKLQLENNRWMSTTMSEAERYIPMIPNREKSPIEEFRLVNYLGCPNGFTIERLLTNIESLKRFVFITDHASIGRRSEDRHLSAKGIHAGMVHHTDTLEMLVLFAWDETCNGSFSLRKLFCYKDKSFTNLRSLAVPQCVIVSEFARKPKFLFSPTLEEIQVQFFVNVGDFRGIDQNDETLGERVRLMTRLASTKKANTLPHLNRVIWWYQPFQMHQGNGTGTCGHSPPFGSGPALQRLKTVFEEVNVKFEWISTELFVETPFGRRLS